MLVFERNNVYLVEAHDPLPELEGNELFFDFETTSFNRGIKSLNPWHNCWVLGVGVKSDNGPAYYVPVNHADNRCNRSQEEVQQWLVRVFRRHKVMIAHNLKYDAQVAYACLGIDTTGIKKHCTLDLSMLIDSDRFKHSLDALSHDWLKEDISAYEEALKPYTTDDKNKDYGYVPTDLMAEYCGQDVITEQRLWKYIQFKMPVESLGVMEMSSQVLDTLIRIERNGMRINPRQVMTEQLIALNKMSQLQADIAKKIGFTIEPHSPRDCHDYLCNHLGFPVLERNDPTKPGELGSPKFDKHVLANYRSLPGAPVEIIDQILEYRKWQMFTSLFCDSYLELHKDGLLHPSYRQTVRTGRMACSLPNMQQCMPEAKMLIVPGEDECIISADYSQIEFRVIVHYINDMAAIQAYADDPFTDFHVWVAEMCEIHRKPAKTVNFMMGYGGGKSKLIKSLSRHANLVQPILEEIERMGLNDQEAKDLFEMRSIARGEQVYNRYHNTLPGLKRTSRQATQRVYQQGWITNKYGRRRTLAIQAAWRAFNTVCQGTAADLMKERLVALDHWLQANYPDLVIIGVVHDEVILRGPKHYMHDEHLLNSICYILEDVQVKLRVPIRTSLGVSDKSWYEASKVGANRLFDRKTLCVSTSNT